MNMRGKTIDLHEGEWGAPGETAHKLPARRFGTVVPTLFLCILHQSRRKFLCILPIDTNITANTVAKF